MGLTSVCIDKKKKRYFRPAERFRRTPEKRFFSL
jgi:hypothetical protein